MVFSFDEKTQVQALDRTQLSLPMKRGREATMTHAYKRHGTTDLFAAMNVATGEVLYDTKARHSSNELLNFFSLIELHVPRDLEIYVVLDNLSLHGPPLHGPPFEQGFCPKGDWSLPVAAQLRSHKGARRREPDSCYGPLDKTANCGIGRIR